MKPVVILLVAAIAAVAEGSVRSVVFPTKTSSSYVELSTEKSLRMTAFTLCFRVATELSGEREIILFAYRTGDYDELNVWRELDGSISFYLSHSQGAKFDLPPLTALQTQLCVVWDSSTGASNIFRNGVKSLTKIYRMGHKVQPGGKVILGQDPDNYFGGFEEDQCLIGDISEVNLWDHVLSDRAIRDLHEGKSVPRGNVINWDTTSLTQHGNVVVLKNKI